MKRFFKRTLAVFMAVVMILCAAPLDGFVFEAEAGDKALPDCSVGDIIEFGSYPQSKVTDRNLETEILSTLTSNILNGESSGFVSYSYYSGTGDCDGQMQPGDYMKYADVVYEGDTYRGVMFSQYRPDNSYDICSEDTSSQDDNGYYVNNIYWFKFEPLRWRVLDPINGFIMCENLIDAQPFSNFGYYDCVEIDGIFIDGIFNSFSCEHYSSDYESSSIRYWLNYNFYNVAFTEKEKTQISISTLDNSSSINSDYDSNSTSDKIFLLSLDEATNPDFGFNSNRSSSDLYRQAYASNYALCQGIGTPAHSETEYEMPCPWSLRTPADSYDAEVVWPAGDIEGSWVGAINFNLGIRPALRLDFNSVTNDEYIIHTVDSAGNPIEGATVKWNDDVSFTDSEGNAKFSRTTIGEPLITVEKDGYHTYTNEGTNFSKSENGYDTIILYKESESVYLLKSAYYKNAGVSTDILASTKRLSTSNADTAFDNGKFSIICTPISTNGVTEYRLYQGSKRIAISTDGMFSNLKISSFEKGGDVNVRVYTSGTAYVATPINLIIDEDFAVKETTLKIGEKIAFEVSDEVPFVGGTTVEFDFPALPVDIYVSGEKVHVGINVDLYKSSGKLSSTATNEEAETWRESMKKSIADIKDTFDTIKRTGGMKVDKELNGKIADIMKEKKQFNLPAAGSVDVQFVGYGEGTWSDKGLSTIKAYICVTVDASVDKTWQTAVWVIPVAVNLDVGVEGKVSAEVILDYDNATMSGDVLFTVKPHIEATGAVGIGKVLGAGAYGAADLTVEMQLVGTTAPTGLNKVDLTGELGITAYAGPFVYKKPFAYNTWHLYSRTQSPTIASNSVVTSMALRGMFDTANYSVADISYLKNESSWLASTPNVVIGTQSVDGTGTEASIRSMLTETYRNSKPVIVTNGTDTIMVYIGAGSSRNAYNIACAMYSVYDSTNDTWSDPVQLDSNSTFDSTAYVYSDGTDIWVVYCDASKEFDENNTLEDFATYQTIKAARFNPETKQFENLATVEQSEGKYISVPEVAVINSVPTVIWQENADADFFGLNSTNEIHYSTFDGTQWSEEATLATGLNSTTGYAVGEIDGGMKVAYITDGDNNLETLEDRQLFVTGDSTVELDTGIVSNPTFALDPATGNNALYWYDEGNLSITTDCAEVSSVFGSVIGFTDKFVVLDGRIVYIGATESSSNLFTTVYDSAQGWCSPVQVTEQSYYIDSFDAACVNGKMLAVLTQRDVTITEDDVDDSCTLAWTIIDTKKDVSVSYVNYDTDIVASGADLPLRIGVDNFGDTVVNSVTVNVYDSENNTVLSETIDVELSAGASTELTVNLPLGSTISLKTYTVEVLADAAEVNTDNNTFEITVGYTDFTVAADVVKLNNNQTVIMAVTNNSYTSSDGKLYVYSITDEEKLIATLDINELSYNESQLLTLDVTEEMIGSSTCVISIVAEPTVEGVSSYNNCVQVYVDFTATESFSTGTIIAVDQSGTVIDDEVQYIYGVAPGLIDLSDYIQVSQDGCTINYTFVNSAIGTGSRVTVKNADGATLATYTVVIFGDVDGNGWYDANDAFLVRMLDVGLLTREAVGEAVYKAADCNHDGVVDGLDVQLIEKASVLLDSVNQSATQAELSLDSAYIEYCSVIDQSAGFEADSEPEKDTVQPPVETQPEAELQFDLVSIFSFIFSIFEKMFTVIISLIG